MVRSYLIENRICFDSDPGSGGGGTPSDEDLDQNLQQDIAMANFEASGGARGNYSYQDNFDRSSYDNQALIGATGDILAADRLAQSTGADRNNAIRGAERFAGQTNSVRAALNNAMNAAPNLNAPAGNVPYETFDNSLARQRLAQQLAVAKAYKAPERQPGIRGVLGYNTPKVALDTIQSQAGQFMMPRISSALENPNMTAVYGANNRVTGAADQYGNLIEGTDPMDSLGLMDDGGSGDDQMASIMPPVDDGSGGGGGGGIGEIPSDELALNYLQNPYYAYSGFGNQYNPYGFAQGTLVDLLQTRGMTQPQQADTLGLFGNPRSFS
jgi:hypothetical protein